MKTAILSLGVLASVLAALPAVAADLPPDTQPGADLIWLLCTVSGRQTSENCRYTSGIPDENDRVKAGSILGYLDAHPFPIPGGAVGADARVLVRLTVTQRPDFRYAIAAAEGQFDPVSAREVRDPAWVYSPYDAWAVAFTPMDAARSTVAGEAGVLCKVIGSGALANCWLEREEPKGWGFGEAALKLLTRARMKPQAANGEPVADRPIAITLKFKPDRRYQPCRYEGVETMCKVE